MNAKRCADGSTVREVGWRRESEEDVEEKEGGARRESSLWLCSLPWHVFDIHTAHHTHQNIQNTRINRARDAHSHHSGMLATARAIALHSVPGWLTHWRNSRVCVCVGVSAVVCSRAWDACTAFFGLHHAIGEHWNAAGRMALCACIRRVNIREYMHA